MSADSSFSERMVQMVRDRDERIDALETLLSKAVKERLEAQRQAERNMQSLMAAIDQVGRLRGLATLMRRRRARTVTLGRTPHVALRCRLEPGGVVRWRPVVMPVLELVDTRRLPPAAKPKRRFGMRKSPQPVMPFRS